MRASIEYSPTLAFHHPKIASNGQDYLDSTSYSIRFVFAPSEGARLVIVFDVPCNKDDKAGDT